VRYAISFRGKFALPCQQPDALTFELLEQAL
jgi:hypothetical protein